MSILRKIIREELEILFEEEKVILKSKSKKGNRHFEMLKTAKFQHYDMPKGELSPFTHGEESRKKLVSKLSKEDKKTYRKWLKTNEGQKSIKLFDEYASEGWKSNNINESIDRTKSLSGKWENAENIPTKFVHKYRNTNATKDNLESLWNDIEENGMNDPVILSIGIKDNTIKLSSGNHRIQLFNKKNIRTIPTIVKVIDSVKNDNENGDHCFDGKDIIKSDLKSSEKLFKPSDVLDIKSQD